ncbi:hypothetical protein M409DRAFT_54059 [Zasmidium cellare ATCC 36951]|uniref:Uncharacterized protein n=1 Tax=Zasmidium cellare ATCC 36951 TaxID=1080233 RepID=A0A6A6CK91_ZASCE|nr:uncharacterized protein M409DRAFT_54059 [Zasmidium cellare ATCC 36951]KAF2167461.1 hypothetical protein M409DRAFT_54059 [Zasmidium cellare ATCC 36951]
MSTVERAFAVVELFENIAIQVHARDVPACRTVCKQWRANIDGSRPAQGKLSMFPAQDDYMASISDTSPRSALIGLEEEKENFTELTPVLLIMNGALFSRSLDKMKEHWQVSPHRAWKVNIRQGRLNAILDLRFDPMSLKPQHKAFDMYLTQPPIKQIDLFAMVETPSSGTKHTKLMFIRNGEGIKAKHIVQHLKKAMLQVQCARSNAADPATREHMLWRESWMHMPDKFVLTEEEADVFGGLSTGE